MNAPSMICTASSADRERRRSPDSRAGRAAGIAGRARADRAPSRSVPAKMNSAAIRCVARRMWLTSGRSTRPEATIHQPIAPCSPPSASKRDEPRAVAARDRPPPPEPQQRQREDQADRPPDQAVEIFPEEDALELAERHAAVDLAIFGRRLVAVELGLPLRLRSAAGRCRRSAPTASSTGPIRSAG